MTCAVCGTPLTASEAGWGGTLCDGCLLAPPRPVDTITVTDVQRVAALARWTLAAYLAAHPATVLVENQGRTAVWQAAT